MTSLRSFQRPREETGWVLELQNKGNSIHVDSKAFESPTVLYKMGAGWMNWGGFVSTAEVDFRKCAFDKCLAYLCFWTAVGG